jgi:MoaA/NifB/PqqE/SkfB family radical SAM enzyme
MAEKRPSYDHNRRALRDVIPLSTPYSSYIEATRACNLKCFYCLHSTRDEPGGAMERLGIKVKHMDMDLYEKIVSELMQFPEQLKRITFSGMGEPLMNPRLGEMARKLRQAGYTGRNDVISNGLLMTKERAAELVDAGITLFMFSVQGLTSERYKEVCGVEINMEEYIDNLRWLYGHKKGAQMYIKILDANFKNRETEEKQFYEMFEDICDMINVEHLVLFSQEMESVYGNLLDGTLSFTGESLKPRKVCSNMFYYLSPTVNGEVYPCSLPGLPTSVSLGNVKEKTLLEIWNGEARLNMIKTNLLKGFGAIPGCGHRCPCAACIANDSEYLDDCATEILKRF